MVRVLLAIVGICAAVSEADARQIDPRNCTQYAPRTTSGVIVDWRDTLLLEHCDRMSRLMRISGHTKTVPPSFSEIYLPADRLPAELDAEVPLLRVVFPERVFFDTDQSTLRPEAMEVVRIVAESLRREPPDVALFVAGHADARGNRAYNQNLSIDRANAVAAAILSEGVRLSTVWRVGFGEDMPLVPGDTPYAYGQNRRVEFLFAARPEAVAVWLADLQVDLLCRGRTQSETRSCRARLDLRDDYLAVELEATTTELELSADQAHAQVDVDTLGREVHLESGGATVDVHTERIAVDVEQRRVIVTPRSSRRFRIDAVNRRVEPIVVTP